MVDAHGDHSRLAEVTRKRGPQQGTGRGARNQREDSERALLQHHVKTQIAQLQRSDSVCHSS